MTNITINPNFIPVIKRVGKEQTAVIVIDDFALNLNDILDDAQHNQTFTKDDNSYYPGVRATLPKDYVNQVLRGVYEGLYKVYGIPRSAKLIPQFNYYSLICQAEQELSLLQRIPHFDTTGAFYFAILHYLNPGPHGGTGLFRHTVTDFERINNDRADHYFKSNEQYMSQYGEPEAKYHIASSDTFELYEEIAYKPNRLVIYPGNLLHSTIVDLNKDIDANPKTGRLTANMFVEFK
ncbi:DUF6445 family protein [Colwelliaceae bacterium BS250]